VVFAALYSQPPGTTTGCRLRRHPLPARAAAAPGALQRAFASQKHAASLVRAHDRWSSAYQVLPPLLRSWPLPGGSAPPPRPWLAAGAAPLPLLPWPPPVSVAVADRQVPAIYFGGTKMNNNFDLVDDVVKKAGAGTRTEREHGGAVSTFRYHLEKLPRRRTLQHRPWQLR